MKRLGGIVVLAALLVAQVVLIAQLYRQPEIDRTGLFAKSLQSNEVAKIILGGTRRRPETITLVRMHDDWIIENANGYPADQPRIGELLRLLGSVRSSEPIVTSRRHHAALEIDDASAYARVRLFAPKSSTPFLDLTFGPSTQTRSTNARLTDGDDVWQVYGLASWDFRSDPAPWMARPFVEFAPEDVTGIRIDASVSSRLQFERGSWILESDGKTEPANPVKVAELLRAASTLTPTAPAGKTNGSLPAGSKADLVLHLQLKSGEAVILSFAKVPGSDHVAVASPDSPFAAFLVTNSVEPILAASEPSALRLPN